MPTIKAKLLTYREDYGGYILYVFENLESKDWTSKYKMTVRFPNWDCPFIGIGDIGYLNYKEVVAGESTWWDKDSQSMKYYNYTNCIFENFIHEQTPEECLTL